MQLCPQLMKRPWTAPVDAFSISASYLGNYLIYYNMYHIWSFLLVNEYE
jgi:hypothetical protein